MTHRTLSSSTPSFSSEKKQASARPLLLLPCCKINIGLNVVRRRPDGYHDLETVFYPLPLTDQLEIAAAPASDAPYTLTLSGHRVAGSADDNLIVRVYRALQEEFNLPPVSIFLRKNIPMGAGLGGGSSDAASMMRGLNELFALGLSDTEMEERVARFGADCAFFIKARPAFATGIGDHLTPIPLSLKGRHIVLVKPDVFVSTREAYAGVSPKPAPCDLSTLAERPMEEWRSCVVNDFEPSVFQAHPRLAAIKQTLYDMGAVYAAMSGSGSTLFGIFDRPVEEAQRVFADCFVWGKTLTV